MKFPKYFTLRQGTVSLYHEGDCKIVNNKDGYDWEIDSIRTYNTGGAVFMKSGKITVDISFGNYYDIISQCTSINGKIVEKLALVRDHRFRLVRADSESYKKLVNNSIISQHATKLGRLKLGETAVNDKNELFTYIEVQKVVYQNDLGGVRLELQTSKYWIKDIDKEYPKYYRKRPKKLIYKGPKSKYGTLYEKESDVYVTKSEEKYFISYGDYFPYWMHRIDQDNFETVKITNFQINKKYTLQELYELQLRNT